MKPKRIKWSDGVIRTPEEEAPLIAKQDLYKTIVLCCKRDAELRDKLAEEKPKAMSAGAGG